MGRGWMHDVLGAAAWRPPAVAGVRLALLVAILAAVTGTVLGTLPQLDAIERRALDALVAVGGLAFALEYVLRLWSAPEGDPSVPGAVARRRYALSLLGLVDLAAALPLILHLVRPLPEEAVVAAGLVGIIKLARHAPGLRMVAAVFRNEARALASALLAMLVVLMLASSAMFLVERHAQPEAFTSIPRAMWWGIVTIASVGYGDMIPLTVGGRVLAGFVMLVGIAMFAVPAGILATGFATELKKREFLVTWQAVAKVPLFAGLDAARIAQIARHLKPAFVPANQVLVRRGDPADAMYFVLSGEVAVDVAPEPVRLGPGHFLGEIALLKESSRTATVTAMSDCQLLALGVADFRRLMAEHPDLKAAIAAVAEERLKTGR